MRPSCCAAPVIATHAQFSTAPSGSGAVSMTGIIHPIVYHENTGQTAQKYFLGVDGGQSSTRTLIGDDAGRVLGKGVGGQSNHARDADRRARLIKAITDALSGV